MRKVKFWQNTGKTLGDLCRRDYQDWNKETHGEWMDLKAEKEKTAQINFWPEGSLIKTGGVPFWDEYEGKRGKRGVISGFSGKAQRRMMEWIAKLRRDDLPTFITLTYPDEWPQEPETWKVHIDRFCVWAEREFGDICQLWKLEDQERGAPHFHLLVWGAGFIPWQYVAHQWAKIIHPDCWLHHLPRPKAKPGKVGAWVFRQWVDFLPVKDAVRNTLKAGVRVEAIKTGHGVKRYISKYMTKKSGELGAAWAHVGRFWGVRGRRNAPKSIEVVYTVTKGTLAKFRRLGRRFMRSKGFRGKAYSRILTDHPMQWARALDLIESGRCAKWDLTHVGEFPEDRLVQSERKSIERHKRKERKGIALMG